MPLAGALAAPWLVYAALAGAAVALYYVGQALSDSGWDATWFVEDIRNGAHNLVEWLLGGLRWLGDWISNVIDWANAQIDHLANWAMRAVEVPRNWGYTLRGWADNLQWAANDVRTGIEGVVAWIERAHYVITTELPALVSGGLTTLTGYVEYRLGQVDAWVDGRVATVTTWVDARLGDLGTWVDGRIATVTGYIDARLGDLGTWVSGQIVSVRQAIDVGVLDAKAFASAAAAAAVSPIEAWIAGWQGLLEWLRSVMPALAAFLANPWAWLFALAGTTLWYLVEGWLSKVWDGEAHLPDP